MSVPLPEDSAFSAVVRLVGAHTGLAFDARRFDDAVAGIRRVMTRAKLLDVEQYLERLQAQPVALDDLVAELTVGETYFFRERDQLDFVRSEIMAEVLARRGPDHVLRAWSAGCASGEEPYSLAIIADQLGLGERVRIVGSDISRPALARARAGRYRPWSLRGLEPALVASYFRASGRTLALDERITRRVAFVQLNLAHAAYPSLEHAIWGLDLVLCRNVLIYLDRPTIARVAARLFEALAPGGWLITGPSDPLLFDHAPFEMVKTPAGLLHRRPMMTAAVSLRPAQPFALPSAAAPVVERAGAAATLAAAEPAAAPPAEQPRAEPDPLARARAALAAGDYDGAMRLTAEIGNAAAATVALRARANRDGAARALEPAAESVRRYPLSAELHFLHAVLLLELGSLAEATASMRRAVYLDRTLAMAHFVLGTLLARQGDRAGAQRAYRNAAELARSLPADTLLSLGDGERASGLAAAADAQLARLELQLEAR